jgi:3-oxoacid CoA-transferase B subunit
MGSDMATSREIITSRVARFFNPGDVVNLGIGMPELVGNYIPEGVLLHTENGLLGYGPRPEAGKEDDDFVGAGKQYLTLVAGAACFDSATSFAIVRGGHLAATVLGALQVDEKGNLANWTMPGKLVGMGGAMDLVTGARQVIVCTEHTAKDGSPKILKNCTLPLTGAGVVDVIVSELCVLDVTEEGLVVREIAPGISHEDLQNKTEATLIFPEQIGTLNIGLSIAAQSSR